MIQELDSQVLLSQTRKSLGLNSVGTIDEILIANSLRRIAGFLCPCPQKLILSTFVKSFKYLVENEEDLWSKTEEVLDRLIVGGDLHQFDEVHSNELNAKNTWVFAGVPSFLIRANGLIFLFGIVADELSPLGSLSERITYQGSKRLLSQKPNENLTQLLEDLGLTKITEHAWLKLPKKVSPNDLLSDMLTQLSRTQISGDIPGLIILDTSKEPSYYRGRWKESKDSTGYFVARRPSLYNQTIWCYVELSNGKLIRYLDIPLKINGMTQRGCDGAWHLQMAIDHNCGIPQKYKIRSSQDGELIDFYSPIPLWAERRLIAIGTPSKPSGCLFSYLISKADLLLEELFLKEYLWLERKK